MKRVFAFVKKLIRREQSTRQQARVKLDVLAKAAEERVKNGTFTITVETDELACLSYRKQES